MLVSVGLAGSLPAGFEVGGVSLGEPVEAVSVVESLEDPWAGSGLTVLSWATVYRDRDRIIRNSGSQTGLCS